ncbi:hypothetical protein HDU76_011925, partial [Blyttiomyces sp. JEL0837]
MSTIMSHKPQDGITRAERRVLARAGVDVLLTHTAFKQPGIPAMQNPPPPTRNTYFSKKSVVGASGGGGGGKDVTFTGVPDEQSGPNGNVNVDPGYLSAIDDDDENTDSYNKVRRIIFGQAIRY